MRGMVAVVRTGGVPDDLSDALTAAGYSVHHEPVLIVSFAKTALPELSKDTPLVFTSANGAAACAVRSSDRSPAVFTVGAQTATAARDAGFETVYDAGGTVRDLCALLLEKEYKNLLYVRGKDVSTDLAAMPELSGVTIQEWIAYETRPAQNLSPALAEALAAGDMAAVMFFSKKGAETFAHLASAAGLAPAFQGIKALCIGEGMVESVSVLPFSSVSTATRPDRGGMIDLINLIDNISDAKQEKR